MKITEPFHFDFFVPMRPQPLQRVRVCKNGFSYTPKESKDAKAYIRHEAIEYLRAEGIEEPMEGNVSIWIKIYCEKPKCWYEGKPVTGGGDWDNHAKTVCDALNKVLYKDDRQIQRGAVIKRYDDRIGYRIYGVINPIPEKPRKSRKKKCNA